MTKALIALLPVILLAACLDNPMQKRIDEGLVRVDDNLEELQEELAAGRLPNAMAVRSYAEYLSIAKPEVKELVENLALEATPGTPHMAYFNRRLHEVKQQLEKEGPGKPVFEELAPLESATVPEVYNLGLLDTVNVLAGLSGGLLPRVNNDGEPINPEDPAISPEESAQVANLKPGEEFVGNPRYGHWDDHGGTRVWFWYSSYSHFGTMNSGFRHSYDDWSNRPQRSYYSRYGSDLYASPNEKKAYGLKSASAASSGSTSGRRSPTGFNSSQRSSTPRTSGRSGGSGGK